MDYKLLVAESLHDVLKDHLELNEIKQLLEKPKMAEHGDLAFPAFQLAKVFRKNPAQIASEIKEEVSSPIIEKSETVGPYLNFFLKNVRLVTCLLLFPSCLQIQLFSLSRKAVNQRL